MGGKESEACGRCAMSSAVSVSDGESSDRDPFGGERIEVSESELRKVSPAAWLGGLKRRVDDWATRLTYGR
ncbi:MAG: hypothetical protein V5A31_03165 [Haloferacaceae archaeon]|jgi:hypothetical protein